MKQGFLKFLICFCFCFVILSCETVQYGAVTENLNILREGEIYTVRIFDKAHNENAIGIKGGVLSTSGSLTIFDTTTRIYDWNGTFTSMAAKEKVKISGIVDNSPYQNINRISIKGMPVKWNFEKFDIESTDSFGMDHMPAMVTSFSLDGKRYTVVATVVEKINGLDNSLYNMHMLMKMSNQIFRIVNDQGAICAEFNKDSYKIFDTGTQIDIDQMQATVAVFSILHRMCRDIPSAEEIK